MRLALVVGSYCSDELSFCMGHGDNCFERLCYRCCEVCRRDPRFNYGCPPDPPPTPQTPAPDPAPDQTPKTTALVAVSLLVLAGLCICGHRNGCCAAEPDEAPAVQQQNARGVPLRQAEQWLQSENLPQADPRQAFHDQDQVCPLPPLDPHAPLAAVEHDHEAASSKPCCVICMVAPAEFACVPCGHMCGCQLCLSKVRHCPICRQEVKQTVKVFVSIV
jgi:hypothetical protein